MLLRARVDEHRLTLGREVRRKVEHVAEHAPAEHHLGRHQATGPARTGINRQVERPRRHHNASLAHQCSVFSCSVQKTVFNRFRSSAEH